MGKGRAGEVGLFVWQSNSPFLLEPETPGREPIHFCKTESAIVSVKSGHRNGAEKPKV
jgi:hypothetical protein